MSDDSIEKVEQHNLYNRMASSNISSNTAGECSKYFVCNS